MCIFLFLLCTSSVVMVVIIDIVGLIIARSITYGIINLRSKLIFADNIWSGNKSNIVIELSSFHSFLNIEIPESNNCATVGNLVIVFSSYKV